MLIVFLVRQAFVLNANITYPLSHPAHSRNVWDRMIEIIQSTEHDLAVMSTWAVYLSHIKFLP